MLFLSFPKFGHGALAWVATAPLLLALHGASGWRALRLGYVAGAVSSLGLLYWTALVVVQYGGMPLVVGGLVMVALCLAFSVFHALFGWTMGRLTTTFGTPGLLGAPLAWVALEYARSVTFFQFPWCLLGYSQHAQLPFIQVASVTAVYGVSFLLVAVSALLAIAVVEPRARRAAGRARRRRRAGPRQRGLRVVADEPPADADRPRQRWASCRAASGRRTSGCRRTPGRTSTGTCG